MNRTFAGLSPRILPKMNRAAIFSAFLDALLEDPVDVHELKDISAVCFRGGIQATTQAAQIPREDPRDLELLTPAEIAKETKASLWSVRAAIALGKRCPGKGLAARYPTEGSTRGAKVPRGVAKVWAGR